MSKVVAVFVVHGVEYVCAGACKGNVGERAGHIQRRKTAVTASMYNERRVRFAAGQPEAIGCFPCHRFLALFAAAVVCVSAVIVAVAVPKATTGATEHWQIRHGG